MEGGFRAMGQIIKLNLRFLSSQLKPLFCRSLLPLLGFPSDDRVRSFAARTFSFIFSNSPFPHKLAKFLLAKCFSGHGHTHHLKEGLSLFFFNSVFDDGEYEDKAAELIGAIILPIFGMPSDSALSRSSISLMTDVFQKFIACGNRSVSTQIIAKLISRVEHVQNANELRTLSQWLLLWMRAKKSALFNKDNKAKLFSLVVDGLQSSDCPEFFEQYLQLVSELLLSHPPPSPLHQSTFLSVLATLGNDLHRLHFLLRCLAQLHTLPFFFTDIMDVVGRLGSSLLSSITSDFKNITQERLQPLRELLIFYSQILTEHFPIEEPLSANRQELSFCLQHHCSLRHFVVAVLHNPSVYPSDFFDLSLTIWPHLWFINEKPEGIDAINAFVMQTVREGTKRTLSEKETERLWKATCAALILQQK
uniref:Uncharacterized protein n=1 Tax=Globodera rostochiensis TaxID=31243 RepID=A0A914HDH1_GLORO